MARKKHMAEKAAQSVMTSEGAPVGVQEVDLSTAGCRRAKADEELEGEIKKALHQASAWYLPKLTVTACDGEVTLTGTVEELSDVERIVSIVESFSGVSGIINMIVPRRNIGKASRSIVDEAGKGLRPTEAMVADKSGGTERRPDRGN